MHLLIEYIKSRICFLLLFFIYGTALGVTKVLQRKKQPPWEKKNTVLIITTFHNVNWFVSHILPFSHSNIEKIFLVCDQEIFSLNKVQYVCPSPLVRKYIPRAISKFVLAFRVALLERPDVIIGYHMFPNAMIAQVLGSVIGRPSCFQLTSGALQLVGGGWQSENPIAAGMQRPSRIVERIVYALVRCFDLVVVRGTKAKKFIRSIGYTGELAIVTGSIGEITPQKEKEHRAIDIIFVGRLAEVKRPEMIVEIISIVKKQHPEIQGVFLGDGPLREKLQTMVRDKDLVDNISLPGAVNDVASYLRRTKVFVLTSEDEGMSIAMLEAMASGVVPVVSDVGDLGDIVRNGETGYLVTDDRIDDFALHIMRLMEDNVLRERLSANAMRASLAKSSVQAVSREWNRYFDLICKHHGCVCGK